MADTVRTIDDFLNVSTGLFKDNTVGDISAQDLRDFVWSSQGRNLDDAGAKTASYTATVGSHARVDMNAAGADFLVTFPGSPVVGDRFAYTLARSHATYNLTVARNGSTLYGSTANESLFTTKEAGHTSIWRYESTSSGQGWVRENEPKVNVQRFDADGTWVKPPGALSCLVILAAGGGGGGSGRKGNSGASAGGGSAGSAGGSYIGWHQASDFSSTETVTVGVGGGGGAAQTTAATNGNNGTAGEDTTFDNLKVIGGGNGQGGTTAGSVSGGAGKGHFCFNDYTLNTGYQFALGAGGGGNLPGDSATASGAWWGCGGGGGGGVNSGGTSYAGGDGGRPALSTTNFVSAPSTPAGGGNTGGSGTAGAAILNAYGLGTGGGGGGGNAGGAGGVGGAGGRSAGGGGGGGAATGNDSGAGGAGGDGLAVIITFCR